ncbi:MAG: serine hydrolase [Novosphingobium sp.]
MSTRLKSRWIAVLAGALALAAPAYAGSAGALESEFDAAFSAPKPVTAKPVVAVRTPTRANITGPAPQSLLVQVRPAMMDMAPAVATFPSQSIPRSFEAQIAALANGSQGRIGVAALDLRTGRTVTVLGTQPFPMASTSKIAIAATFLAGVDAGRLNLATQYPLMMPLPSKKFDGPVAPVRRGTMYSALELIELSLTRSDNHATDALLAAVGGPQAVTRWVQSRTGITEFSLDRDIATLVRDDGAVNPAFTVERRDSITPVAMVRLLSGLYRGDWLSPTSRDVLLGAMGRCVTGRNRIKALLPEGTQVAHKTGTLSNTSSDVGIIRTPDGRDMAVAIYVTGQGGKAGREARIANLARALYDGYLVDAPVQHGTALR